MALLRQELAALGVELHSHRSQAAQLGTPGADVGRELAAVGHAGADAVDAGAHRLDPHVLDDHLGVPAGVLERKGVGARGLRALFEEVLENIMFTAPERAGETVEIDRQYVEELLAVSC